MFNIPFLTAWIASLRYTQFDAYTYVPGQWYEYTCNKGVFKYLVEPYVNETSQDGNQIPKYHTEINETSINISVLSKTAVRIEYGNEFPPFDLNFTQKSHEDTIFDGYIPNDIYLSVTTYSKVSFEASFVFPHDKSTIHTIGLFKKPDDNLGTPEYLIIFGLALVITYFFKKYT